MEYFQEVSWTEPIVSRRGLKRPVSMQAGMLDFNPACVQPAEVSKFCSANNRIQRLAIVEWSIMKPGENSGVLGQDEEGFKVQELLQQCV